MDNSVEFYPACQPQQGLVHSKETSTGQVITCVCKLASHVQSAFVSVPGAEH